MPNSKELEEAVQTLKVREQYEVDNPDVFENNPNRFNVILRTEQK